ncbi:peptidyl-prolyl cis-trans isomerase B (cyclophilin B) [Mycolicibacterium neoaurum]|uniref:peptidylprolyl isomerase n=1 Tax=Mycolicibacterium neoaurum TaxID=1795 RepID=UPI000569BE5B|nr:peptidylprolyl isomerase [Mycolicibacterium neoaurum]SDE26224.1 peptidyl-prolyl cis-trans isomerase B (cyclophilin B) [Mycolicibacterium neoaurum]
MSVPPPYGYPPPQWGYPPAQYGYPPERRPTNSLAVAALICGILVAPLGIVFGHISLYQIKRSGDEGRGMAIAGLVLGYLLTAFGVLVLIVAIVATRAVVEDIRHYNPSGPGYTATPGVVEPLPEFKAPAALGSNCQYLPTPEKAAKPVDPPLMGRVPTTPATIEAEISTDRGYIGLQLDNGKAPCTVNNFASLSAQGFFDDTTCHRLTTNDTLGVLQCGDPTGTGDGGPGYRFPNEYPTNQFRLTDPAIRASMLYPRGTLAMANAGAGTNGSQFFLVYKDSQLPPTYTVFGTIDPSGLKVLDEIAADGVADGGDDGKPATTVTIEAVVVQ